MVCLYAGILHSMHRWLFIVTAKYMIKLETNDLYLFKWLSLQQISSSTLFLCGDTYTNAEFFFTIICICTWKRFLLLTNLKSLICARFPTLCSVGPNTFLKKYIHFNCVNGKVVRCNFKKRVINTYVFLHNMFIDLLYKDHIILKQNMN